MKDKKQIDGIGDIVAIMDATLIANKKLRDKIIGGINAILEGTHKEEIAGEIIDYINDNYISSAVAEMVYVKKSKENANEN